MCPPGRGQQGGGADVSMKRISIALENRGSIVMRVALGATLALFLLAGAGCSTDNTEEQEAAEYPNLNKVPEKPETVAALAEADKIGEGLRADRENARYTDESLRADTSLQPPLARPEPKVETVTTEVSEKITETAGTTTVTETVKETVEEVKPAAPVVAKVEQEPVQKAPLAPPAVAPEPKTETPPPAPIREQVISGESAAKPAVESVFEQQLAAQNATRLPEGVAADGSGTATATATASSSATAPATAAPAASGSEQITLRPPANDGGRTIPNYAASDGTTPIETIYFAQGSHRINGEDRVKLDRIARTQMAAGGTLKIVGHASSRTREMAEEKHMIVNLNVSQQRAAAIAEYFIRAGVAPTDLVIESVSDTEPRISEPMPSAEAMNRRAEIFLLN